MENRWWKNDSGEWFNLEQAVTVRFHKADPPSMEYSVHKGSFIPAGIRPSDPVPDRLVVWFGADKTLVIKGQEKIKKMVELLGLPSPIGEPQP
jgi:hypothetical protein